MSSVIEVVERKSGPNPFWWCESAFFFGLLGFLWKKKKKKRKMMWLNYSRGCIRTIFKPHHVHLVHLCFLLCSLRTKTKKKQKKQKQKDDKKKVWWWKLQEYSSHKFFCFTYFWTQFEILIFYFFLLLVKKQKTKIVSLYFRKKMFAFKFKTWTTTKHEWPKKKKRKKKEEKRTPKIKFMSIFPFFLNWTHEPHWSWVTLWDWVASCGETCDLLFVKLLKSETFLPVRRFKIWTATDPLSVKTVE